MRNHSKAFTQLRFASNPNDECLVITCDDALLATKRTLHDPLALDSVSFLKTSTFQAWILRIDAYVRMAA